MKYWCGNKINNDVMGGICTYFTRKGEEECRKQFWPINLKEKDYLGDTDFDGRIIQGYYE
jgi:hypothetical protein